jgi:hypothetical protein
MLLKCIDRKGRTPFRPGRKYDVARILEMPDCCMVKTKTGGWPKPGDSFFGWHTGEFFETPKPPKELEAKSCGYRLCGTEFYGILIPNTLLSTNAKLAQLLACLQTRQNQSAPHAVVWKAPILGLKKLAKGFHEIGYSFSDVLRIGDRRAVDKLLARTFRGYTIPAPNYHDLQFWKEYPPVHT